MRPQQNFLCSISVKVKVVNFFKELLYVSKNFLMHTRTALAPVRLGGIQLGKRSLVTPSLSFCLFIPTIFHGGQLKALPQRMGFHCNLFFEEAAIDGISEDEI